jgi:CMP-N-acetylneuraminic acid synthetase
LEGVPRENWQIGLPVYGFVTLSEVKKRNKAKMIDNKRILAVVPARGGSKGIPLKNLQEIAGVPLVGIAGQIARQVVEIDQAVVSTDHPDIALAAKQYGLLAPFMRPDSLSGDRIGDLEVLQHALHEMERKDSVVYDIILMLQPTSPMRTARHVQDCVRKLVAEERDAVWTVSTTDSKAHPLKQLHVDKEGTLSYYDPRGQDVIARQQLLPVYHRNGICYAITRECLLEQQTIKGANTAALIVDGNHISIDTLWDLELVEYLVKKGAA